MTGLTVVKRFTYRGDTNEEFSNKYHWINPVPTDTAQWTALLQSVQTAEAAIFPANVHFVRAYGYNSSDPKADHVFQYDYETPGPPPAGTMVNTTGFRMAGDQAACVEFRTDRNNDSGKPIYLRKYLHAGYVNIAEPDELDPPYVTLLNTYGHIVDSAHGLLTNAPGTDKSPPGTALAQLVKVIPTVTTRTLKRRGKRPRKQSSPTAA